MAKRTATEYEYKKVVRLLTVRECLDKRSLKQVKGYEH